MSAVSWVRVCRVVCCSFVTVLHNTREAAVPQGGPEFNYHSPEAADWLAGNGNAPDSRAVELSSFDLHIINC